MKMWKPGRNSDGIYAPGQGALFVCTQKTDTQNTLATANQVFRCYEHEFPVPASGFIGKIV